MRTPFFIMKDLVARHEQLKDPKQNGEYGQDDELYNLLDELGKALKHITAINMKETM